MKPVKASILFLLTVPMRFFCESFILRCVSVLFLLCFRARLFIDALRSPAGKVLASWLLVCDVLLYEVVTFPCVSWVRCGA